MPKPKLPGVEADRVAPKLWQGSYPRPPLKPGEALYGPKVLDVPASIALLRAAGVTRWVRVAFELPHDFKMDDVLSHHENFAPSVQQVHAAADAVIGHLRHGHRVLVSCNQGRNRSGLVVGLVLVRYLGLSGEEAYGRIVAARGPGALANESFRHYLCRMKRD